MPERLGPYELGRVHVGDCLEAMKQLPDGCVEICVTSPPYNQLGSRIPTAPTGMHKGNGFLAKVSANGYADDMDELDYQKWQSQLVHELRRVCKSTVWYNHKLRYRDGLAISPMRWLGHLPLWAEIVWDRGGGMALNANRFVPSDERIYGIDAPEWWDASFNTKMTVWRIAPFNASGTDHPCPYPLEIPKRLIGASCSPGGIVVDPFAGSGTTGVACAQMGRKFLGFEIDPHWAEVANQRMEAAAKGLTLAEHRAGQGQLFGDADAE